MLQNICRQSVDGESLMYFATNIEEIQNAMNAKAPRPIREVILDYYPDCTIDRNNRAHAPYEGYVCEFTGKSFRAGEYLPFEPNEDDVWLGKTGSKPRLLWVFSEGEIYSFEGTKTQIKAGAEIAKTQTAEFDKNSNHVGELKKRAEFNLRLMTVFVNNEGMYGPEFTHMFRDENNNSVVYKGTKKIECKYGDTVTMVATVKSHWTSKNDGRKATYVNRPKIV